MLSGAVYAYATPGATLTPPPGFQVSNLDPNINSPFNNQIYDPNFIPGFDAGLQNVSIDWRTGYGYAKIGYSVGPLSHAGSTIPHFAMGPQCCNFAEVPHTQQFRKPSWGDYYYVRAGLGSPGINVENYTALFGAPSTYVGLRTDWNWTISIALNWSEPVLLNSGNEWAAIGVTVTQYVPSAPGKLVYTLVNFWMDENSSSSLSQSEGGVALAVSAANLVTYHPIQMQGAGNETVNINLSPFLSDTIRRLNLTTTETQPPLIPYVYLNVEGYNFRWNSTVWSYNIFTPSQNGSTLLWQTTFFPVGVAVVLGGSAAVLFLWSRSRKSREVRGPLKSN